MASESSWHCPLSFSLWEYILRRIPTPTFFFFFSGCFHCTAESDWLDLGLCCVGKSDWLPLDFKGKLRSDFLNGEVRVGPREIYNVL